MQTSSTQILTDQFEQFYRLDSFNYEELKAWAKSTARPPFSKYLGESSFAKYYFTFFEIDAELNMRFLQGEKIPIKLDESFEQYCERAKIGNGKQVIEHKGISNSILFYKKQSILKTLVDVSIKPIKDNFNLIFPEHLKRLMIAIDVIAMDFECFYRDKKIDKNKMNFLFWRRMVLWYEEPFLNASFV